MPPNPPSPKKSKPLRIAILAYAGCMATEIFAVADVLLIAGHIAHAMRKPVSPAFEVQVVGLRGRTVAVAGGFSVGAHRPLGVYDMLIVPGLEIRRLDEWDSKLAPLRRELVFIRKSFSSGTPVASVCIGTFLLGEAGLLGRLLSRSVCSIRRHIARELALLRLDSWMDRCMSEDLRRDCGAQSEIPRTVR